MMNPLMADTASEYIRTVLYNVEADKRLKEFLSPEEKSILEEAMSIINDIASVVRVYDKNSWK